MERRKITRCQHPARLRGAAQVQARLQGVTAIELSSGAIQSSKGSYAGRRSVTARARSFKALINAVPLKGLAPPTLSVPPVLHVLNQRLQFLGFTMRESCGNRRTGRRRGGVSSGHQYIWPQRRTANRCPIQLPERVPTGERCQSSVRRPRDRPLG
jgi:hypothetical protein